MEDFVADDRLADQKERAGVPIRVNGHVLRRSVGGIADLASVPRPTIQRVCGHAPNDQNVTTAGAAKRRLRPESLCPISA